MSESTKQQLGMTKNTMKCDKISRFTKFSNAVNVI